MLIRNGLFSGLVAVLAVAAGCDSRPPAATQSASSSLKGQEVNLIVPDSMNLPAVWEILVQEWSSQSGASVKFVEYDCNGFDFDKSLPTLASGGNVLIFPLNRLSEVSNAIGPLTIREGEFDSRDLFKGLRERILTRDRNLVANPISVPILTCYYRGDLLGKANKSAPETWDEYDELVSSIDQWAPGLTAVEPLSPDSRATTFFARSLAYCKHPENYSVWFDVDTGKPTLDTAGFERALEVSIRTWKRMPKEVVTYGPDDCRRLVLTGKAAIALCFETSEAVMTSVSSEKPTLERPEGIEIGLCRLPGSRTVFNRNSKKWDSNSTKGVHAPALCGFAGLASAIVIPKGKNEDSAAMNLLASLSSTDVFSRAFSSLPKSVTRESQVGFGPGWYGPELASEEASQYSDAVAQSLRDSQVVFELPLIGATEFRMAASQALEPLLTGEADPKQTMQTMQKSFELIVERIGPEKIRDSHRRGLGLAVLKKP